MLAEGEMIEEKYEIIRVLGRGGMSTVYLAWQETLGKERAIKEICRTDCDCYEELRQRLIREANILKDLRHPNLPDIIDVVIREDALLIIMEYIPGCTLKEIQEDSGMIGEEKAIMWGKQLCEVLLYLHRRDPPIIYRDLKPSNVMCRPDGRLVLIDFGTAREQRDEAGGDTVCLGTRGYAAPEQYGAGQQTDARTDIYCLGATLYHLLTGKSPEQPPYQMIPIRRWNPGLSPGLEEFVLTCTQADPGKRYQNCEETLYALTHLKESTRQYRRKAKKKICLFLLLTVCMGLSGTGAFFCRNKVRTTLKSAIRISVEQAERAEDRQKKREYYMEALAIMPEETSIYESLLNTYVGVNDFQIQDAAELMNILEMTGQDDGQLPVLETLRRENPETYAAFCYAVGIGYFFYMGTVEGKKAAGIWFEDACHVPAGSLSDAKRQRAQLYARISSYYDTFLSAGKDKSGEQRQAGYEEFFETLCELNTVPVQADSAPSQAAAAYMASVEVAVEIGSFAAEFQEEGDIPCEKLQAELDKIYVPDNMGEQRIYILEKFRSEEEIENLKNLVVDAGRKNMLAATNLNQGGMTMG